MGFFSTPRRLFCRSFSGINFSAQLANRHSGTSEVCLKVSDTLSQRFDSNRGLATHR